MGIASLVECSAVGALGATLAALYKKNLNCDYQNHHNLGSLIITEKY